MSRSTPCPDLVHLRLFFHKPTFAPATDSVRAHLAQCEVCRAILAGFEVGDKAQNTLAFEGVVPAKGLPEAADKHQNTLVDEAVDPARQAIAVRRQHGSLPE